MQAIEQYAEIVKSLAYIVTALPPIQVSVKRLRLVLQIIQSDFQALTKEDSRAHTDLKF